MLVAEKYKEHAWSRILAEAVNGIFVDRYNADLNAMREILRRIKKGGVVVMAPEGTRSPTCCADPGMGWRQLYRCQIRTADCPCGCNRQRR